MGEDSKDAGDEDARQLTGLLDDLERFYWVPLLNTPFQGLDGILEKSGADCPALHPALSTFATNLRAAHELLDFPYFLLSPLVLRDSVVWKQLRAMGGVDAPGAEGHAKRMVQELMAGCLHHLRDQAALARLMHQGCLLAWGAFETFCKSVFISCLNQRPALFGVLMRNQSLRERFGISGSSWPGLLESHGYDLNGKLGTVVGSDKDFSSPQLLRDLFPPLLAELGGRADFTEAILNERLWLLGQRRHLIAHRCAIVDQEYLAKTKDTTQELGATLRLRGRDLAEALGVVAHTALCLYGAARHCWPRPAAAAQEGPSAAA